MILPLLFLSGGTPAWSTQDVDLERFGKALERVVGKIRPAVVGVKIVERVENKDGASVNDESPTVLAYRKRTLLQASGIILTKSGEVATLLTGGLPEVDEDGERLFEITLYDGEVFAARWKATDAKTGITLLQIQEAPKLQAVRISRENKLQPGSTIIGLGGSIHLGQVSRLDRGVFNESFFFPRTIQTNLPALPGDVGGLLADTSGNMVGMLAFAFQREQGGLWGPKHSRGVNAMFGANAATLTLDTKGMVCAVPADLLLRICKELRSRGTLVRGYVGAHFGFRSRADLHKIGQKYKQGGAQVWKVDPNGPAHQAGLRPMDIIFKIEEREIKTRADLHWFCEQVEYGPLGKAFKVNYLRISKEFSGLRQTTITITRTPPPAK
ncbi:MAG: S1C family serine protease [Planctomycetota bacterium]